MRQLGLLVRQIGQGICFVLGQVWLGAITFILLVLTPIVLVKECHDKERIFEDKKEVHGFRFEKYYSPHDEATKTEKVNVVCLNRQEIERLYVTLSEGYEIGVSLGEFSEMMQDPKLRRRAYDYLVRLGEKRYGVRTMGYDDFEKALGVKSDKYEARVRAVYDALKSEYDVEGYSDFAKAIAQPERRHKIYDAFADVLSNRYGNKVIGYDTFEKALGVDFVGEWSDKYAGAAAKEDVQRAQKLYSGVEVPPAATKAGGRDSRGQSAYIPLATLTKETCIYNLK